MARGANSETHYQVLRILPSATQAEIKAAYHRVLLSSHPDKKNSPSLARQNIADIELSEDFDAVRIQDAHRILSDVDARAAYDASLTRSPISVATRANSSGPRPAQVVSLEDFSCMKSENGTIFKWTHACRCGGTYSIDELDMEDDRHLVACDRCSEVVYVGYQALEEEGNEN